MMTTAAWPEHQLQNRFTVDQIRFLNFKAVPGGHVVTTAGGQVIPPPPWSHLTGGDMHWADYMLAVAMACLFIPAGAISMAAEWLIHWWRTRKL
jgi:hypothetical protein